MSLTADEDAQTRPSHRRELRDETIAILSVSCIPTSVPGESKWSCKRALAVESEASKRSQERETPSRAARVMEGKNPIMLSNIVQKELDSARHFGEQMESVVINKQYLSGDRNVLLLAYWDLVSDFNRGIHALIKSGFCASAFALVRPIVESLVRAHVAIKGSEVDLQQLQSDVYRVNLETIGPWIDAEFGLGQAMENFLTKQTRHALHSYTHS